MYLQKCQVLTLLYAYNAYEHCARIILGDWQDGDELGNTWQSRNTFSFGRGNERGTARPELLQSLLQSTERIVQEIDSVEYGLTDIQEYFANTGIYTQYKITLCITVCYRMLLVCNSTTIDVLMSVYRFTQAL
jgi:cobalamin biosynthesis Mg chelatase CobN